MHVGGESIPRLFYGKSEHSFIFPDLIKIQRDSYDSFVNDHDSLNSINYIFSSIFNIKDPYGRATLEFVSCELGHPKYTPYECIKRGVNYASPLKATFKLILWNSEGDEENRTFKDVKVQPIYIGDIPMMTESGTFIINGTERVVVSQVHRSPGVFFDNDKGKTYTSGKLIYSARIIPYRGSWIDFEFDAKDIIYFRIDRKRKLPITILLRVLGLNNQQILDTFYDKIEAKRLDPEHWLMPFRPNAFKGVKLSYDLINAHTKEVLVKAGTRISMALAKKLVAKGLTDYIIKTENLLGYFVANDIVDSNNVIILAGQELTNELINRIALLNIDKIYLLNIDNILVNPYVRNTLFAHNISYEDALIELYKVMRPGEIATPDSALSLFSSTFFDATRYDLLAVGRIRINARLGLNFEETLTTLTPEDILHTIKELVNLQDGNGEIDDIDNLSNRRVRSVGEFIENQFRLGLARMAKVALEHMATVDVETVMPCDLINSKILIAVIKEFFSSSQLSQFMDQTNPLSEITHKRRLSALGPGGLTRDRAGFEVRDVHPSHYGRICPIETPEGQNIGLISSLATYARINKYGFIESPYRKIVNGVITQEIKYLSAIEESKAKIAQANSPVDEENRLLEDLIYCRYNNDFAMVRKEEVDYVDVSHKQIVSVAASLIPFLENDDANRALMGSNMQRQAVPLLQPEAPLIGTGMEAYVAKGSSSVLIAKRAGVVEYVDALNIVLRSTSAENFWIDYYNLHKFQKSNHNTCINQKPRVAAGQYVKAGQVIADGPATDQGELALGRNLKVAFLPFYGYNFEDSIVISSRVIEQGYFDSVHIEEYECVCRDTRLGPEEVTRDIPNVGEEFLCHLDEFGIVYIGAEVEAGDVLVGKVTPKSESPMTAEEKLLRAIFGEKAIDVRDTSIYVPPGASGTVTDVQIFLRRGLEKEGRMLLIEERQINEEKEKRDYELKIIEDYIYGILEDKLVGEAVTKEVTSLSLKPGDLITTNILNNLSKNKWWQLPIANAEQIHELRTSFDRKISEAHKKFDTNIEKIQSSDDLPQGVLMVVKVFIAIKHKLQPGDKMSGRHGNKGVISRIMPVESMPYLADGVPVDIVLNPLGVPSRMNVGQILETHLGWAAVKLGINIAKLLDKNLLDDLRILLLEIYQNQSIYHKIKEMNDVDLALFANELRNGIPIAAPVFEGPKEEEIARILKLAQLDASGQEILFDGLTGEAFDRKVTVGNIYMLKLHHLVDDKIHARSVGPYSLITQQPLGGKSHFGGQRFGEMECWALQAYGASYILQEMLTVKSDDVVGRNEMYEAIVKGQTNFKCNIPESFRVMINELKALGLNVELLKEEGEKNSLNIEE